jgi:ComF family protein
MLWALGLFDHYYRELIHAFKFHGRTDCGEFLADRLATVIAADQRHDAITCVMPVPLHSARQRERGFNQSHLLAARIAGRIDRPLADTALSRVRNTRTQTQLSVEARRQNVTEAFAAHPPEPPPHTVLLVDDVLTTGATLAACATALQEAGTKEILGAVVALAE